MSNKEKQTAPAMSTRVASFGSADEGLRSAPSTLNEEARTVGVTVATETPTLMFDWDYGRVNEVLLMSGAEFPASGQVPLLDSHNRWSVESQIGSLRALQVQGDSLFGEAYFSSTAEKAFTLVREGHLTDLSVGYTIKKRVFVPENTTQTIDGRSFEGPVKVVTRWEVKEGSFTPIGADKNAKTRAASDGNNMEDSMPTPEENKTVGRAENVSVPQTSTNGQPVATPPEATETRADNATVSPFVPVQGGSAVAQPSNDSLRADHADIFLMGRTHDCLDLAEEAIRSGTSVNAFRAQVLDALAKRSAQHAPSAMPRTEMGLDSGEKFRAAATDALLLRSGLPVKQDQMAQGAEELRGYGLVELARESLRMAGQSVAGDPYDVVGRAFTSSDFPHVLADVAHKAVLVGAQEANETFELWTGEVTANDFKDHSGVAIDAFSSLDEVPEGSEYRHGVMGDRGITYKVVTYGKLFAITRQAIINSDMNSFTVIPQNMGRAAMRTCGNAVYDLLIQNPKMADGFNLFHVNHKNLATTGAKVDGDSFSVGVTAMGTHMGARNEALNISPHYILTPIAQKSSAFTLLNSQVIGTQAQPNQANPWLGAVVPIAEARLDANGSKAWFLAGPKGWSINTAWLFGNKSPRVEQRQGWTIDGVEHKVSLDFGAYINDYRALYKNPGK